MTNRHSGIRLLPIVFILCTAAPAQTTIYVPDGVTKATQISSCTGTNPTICTSITNHGFSAGDVVQVYNLIEYTGSIDQYSAINSPAGSARKVSASGLTANTLAFTDLSGIPVNTSNTVLIHSGFVRKVVPSTVVAAPRVGLGGLGSCSQMSLAATIMDATLTNIIVSSGTATINYAYPHCISGSGNKIQVRNAAQSDLNGVKTVTVTGAQTVTYSTTASNATDASANLSVSSLAIDSTVWWEKVKYGATYYGGSASQNLIYQASEGHNVYFFWAADAIWYYVDPSQSSYLSYAKTAITTNLEDFYPVPWACVESHYTWCYQNGSGTGNNRTPASDYLRQDVPNIMLVYTILTARGQLTSGQKKAFANYMLNDVDTSCTHPTLGAGPGTITISGTSVIGVGTSFKSLTAGSYIGQWVLSTTDTWARITSITDDTHMTITSGFGNGAGVTYYVGGNFTGNECGIRNFYNHHGVSDGSRDARLYMGLPAPTGDVPQDGSAWDVIAGRWNGDAGNNQSLTASLANISIASGLATDDSRALDLLARIGTWSYDYHLAEQIGDWGGTSVTGPNYQQERTDVFSIMVANIARRSSSGFPDWVGLGHTTGAKQHIYNWIYGHIPSSLPSDPRWVAEGDNWYWNLATTFELAAFAQVFGVASGSVEAQYWNYFLTNKVSDWTYAGAFAYQYAPMWLAGFPVNPNADAAVNYSALPLQVQLYDSDVASCASMGLHCGDNDPASYFPQGIARRAAAHSRTAWSGSPTLIRMDNRGQNQSNGVNDHGAWLPGNFHIFKAASTTNGDALHADCLVGDNDNGHCQFGESAGYGPAMWPTTTTLDAGGAYGGSFPYALGPVMTRWSGATKFGDAASRYMAITWDLKSFYNSTPTKAERTHVHFKSGGTDEFFVTFDEVARSSSYAIAAYTHYPQGAPTGCCTAGTTTYSGGLLTSTNPDKYRIMTRWLAPAGATTLAVVNDGTSYSGNAGLTNAYRLRHCSSSDGSACSAQTSMQAIEVSYITTNAISSFSTSLVTPDSHWACAQMTGAADTKLACFSRGGLQPGPASFTPSWTGTGKVLLTGLIPGIYDVLVGGVPVVSGIAVNPGDNSLYFESTAGTVLIIGQTCSIVTATLPDGHANSAYASTLQTAHCSAPVSWSILGGTICSGLSLASSTGVISGVPQAGQACNFTVQVTDGASNTATQNLSMSVTPPGAGVSGGVAVAAGVVGH